jgi:hypothetical protein
MRLVGLVSNPSILAVIVEVSMSKGAKMQGDGETYVKTMAHLKSFRINMKSY